MQIEILTVQIEQKNRTQTDKIQMQTYVLYECYGIEIVYQ